MSRAKSPTVRDVERAYAQAREVLPRLGVLTHDEPTHNSTRWYIGRVVIGETSREAMAFLYGARLGVQFAGFAGAA